MSRPFDPSRRRVLVAGVSILAAAASPAAISALAGLVSGPSRADELRALVRDRRTAARLGRRYLALSPGERDARRLERLLLDHASRSSARDQVARGLTRDFARGETVTLDGWVFSRTEARLFALVELA